MLRRTWDDFVELAHYLFGDDADNLRKYMGRYHLTQNQITFYINWVAGMKHREIAKEFGMTRNGVTLALMRLRKKWPYLFRLKQPRCLWHYTPSKHDEYIVRKF